MNHKKMYEQTLKNSWKSSFRWKFTKESFQKHEYEQNGNKESVEQIAARDFFEKTSFLEA